MGNKPIMITALFILLTACFTGVNGQVAITAGQYGDKIKRAMDLYEKEKYGAAIEIFDRVIADEGFRGTIIRSDAQYYGALAAMALFHSDAESRLMQYIGENQNSPRRNRAFLNLADHFYQTNNHRKAIENYERVNRAELDAELLPAYFFRYGYSLMQRGDRERAMLMFSEIKDIDTDFTIPAIYYFAHLAYEGENYLTAMDGFVRLVDDETFGAVVPFYIVQILYIQKDYDAILEMAPGLLSSAGRDREIELYRFIGDAWFHKGEYEKAIEYLEQFRSGTRISTREDRYQLAFSYYKTGQCDKAVPILNDLIARNDILSQNAWSMLGDCYLQSGDKERARLTFGAASQMDFDRNIKEEALFNYAKLTYEISESPFGEVISAFESYIDQFPASERVGEAHSYLISAYIEMRNYQAALQSLELIEMKDARLEAAYQRVSFFRGLELFRNMEFQQAADMFERSLGFGRHNNSLRARALYWLAETQYRRGLLDEAIANYTRFMGIPGAADTDEYSYVRYNMGYAYYNTGRFDRALPLFKSFESEYRGSRSSMIHDARNRIADCYYIATNYEDAIRYYDMVIAAGYEDSDYAMYQKAFALGLMNNQIAKIETLTQLMSRYPGSYLYADALFERGRAYIATGESDRAETDMMGVISNHPSSAFVPRAYVQLGLIHYNAGDNEKAIEKYKAVITKFPSTEEAGSAQTGLRNAYMDMNEIESYFAFMRETGGYEDVTMSERDTLQYRQGENLYIEGDCERAIESLTRYLEDFPSGIFRVNAQFYLAECLFDSGEYDRAYDLFLEVIKTPNVQFAEQALGALADIAFDRDDYEQALSFYDQLERIVSRPESLRNIYAGQIRAATYSGDPIRTIAIAEKILDSRGMPEELLREAAFMAGNAYLSQENPMKALEYFRMTATEVVTAEGAESKYRVAEILFRAGRVDEAEKVVDEFRAESTSHQYWMARIFILWADISIHRDDKLMARATLIGLLDYYGVDDDGILDEVRAKLAEIDQLIEDEGKEMIDEGAVTAC